MSKGNNNLAGLDEGVAYANGKDAGRKAERLRIMKETEKMQKEAENDQNMHLSIKKAVKITLEELKRRLEKETEKE